jgi:hypothetical protein
VRALASLLALLSISILLFVLADCGGGGQPATTNSNNPPPPPPPPTTVVATPITCPTTGLAGTACYALAVTCENIPTYTVYLKTIAPTGTPIAVATLIMGGTSIDLYENFVNGTVTVQNLVNADILTIQISFANPFTTSEAGWQTNAGGAGVRAASCRYAAVTQWIKSNLAAQVPLCATGSSAGAAQIGEGLAHYSLASVLAFAELTSGPPFTRVDYACIPSLQPTPMVEYCSGADDGEAVSVHDAEQFIDPAYPGAWCSESIENNDTTYQTQFLNDSVSSPDAVLSYPSTPVWFLYGGQDDTPAINQGELYRQLITSSTNRGCVADASHNVPDALDGAEQIASDIIAQCTSSAARNHARMSKLK